MDALICPGCSRRLRPTQAAQEVRCPLCGAVFTPAPPPRKVSEPKPVPDATVPVPAVTRPWYWNRWVKSGLFVLAWCIGVAGVIWGIRRSGMDDRSTATAQMWEKIADWITKHGGPPPQDQWHFVKQYAERFPSNVVPFVRGTLYAREDRYEEAEAEFAQGMANPPPPRVLKYFDPFRARSRYYVGGDVVAAYDAIGPGAIDPLIEVLKIDGDDETMEKLLARVQEVEGLDAQRLQERAEMYARLGRVDEAMADRKALKDRPTAVVATLARGGKAVEAYRKAPTPDVFREAAEGLTQDDDLRRLIQARRGDAADDPLAALYAGRLHARAGEHAEAAAEFTRAVRGLVGEKHREAEVAYLQAMSRLGRGSVAWWRMGRPRALVPALRAALAGQKRGAELERLAAHLRRESGEGPDAWSVEIEAMLVDGRLDRAVALCQRHRAVRPWDPTVMEAFARAGQAVAWYRGAPDRAAAFARLAATEAPIAVLEEHGRDHPNDPTLNLAWGKLYLRRKDHAQAERCFRRAMTSQNEAERTEAQAGLQRALVALGRAAEAARPGLDRAALDAIVRACVEDRRPDQLQEVIAAQRGRVHSLPLRWQIADAWLRGQHAQVVGLFRGPGRAISIELRSMPEVGQWYVESLRALGEKEQAEKERRRLARRPVSA